MKSLSITISLLTFALLVQFELYAQQHTAYAPVVVELFTSQGCSSCPAADRLLKQLVEEAEEAGRPVYGLSFHVSYWNYLGWKDPYSTEEHTNRQRRYAQAFSNGSVYTPQMIVNGKSEFVGSDARMARLTIAGQLKQTQMGKVFIRSTNVAGNLLSLTYEAEAKAGMVVQVAVVERDVTNYVPSGENRGRNLYHEQVVRQFKSYAYSPAARVEVELPSDLDLLKSAVVVYLQDPESYEITGAAMKQL